MSQHNAPKASSHEEIPAAAAQAFSTARQKALQSKVGVVVVKDGKLVRERLINGVVTQVEVLGAAPQPLHVGAGSSKKIKR